MVLLTIVVHVWQIDLITEQHHPLVELCRSQDNAVRSTSVFTVVVKCLEKKLWRCCTGEIQAYNLHMEKKSKVSKRK